MLSEITYFPGGKLGEVLPQGAGGGVDQVGARRETKIQQDILKVFFSLFRNRRVFPRLVSDKGRQ